jgi:hypothetical protein
MVPMTNTQPDIRRGEIRLPIGTNPTAVLQAARVDAQSRLPRGEEPYDFQLGPATTAKGEAMQDFPYSYQVVKQGGQRLPDRQR